MEIHSRGFREQLLAETSNIAANAVTARAK
jgi:hypothetical protein